jgi:putative transposase
MPDHVHAIVWFPQTRQLSSFMHEWKRQSSLRIRTWYRTAAPRYAADFGEGKRFWQQKYYSISIEERKTLEEKLVYMHQNPVRAGIVQCPTDWPWSSAHWYDGKHSVGVPITWVDCGLQ